MANGDQGQSGLSQQAGTDGTSFGGDPGDQAFLMNRKVAKAAGNPVALVDRDFQRLQRQSSRTPFQNVPNQSIGKMLMSAARGKRGRKKF